MTNSKWRPHNITGWLTWQGGKEEEEEKVCRMVEKVDHVLTVNIPDYPINQELTLHNLQSIISIITATFTTCGNREGVKNILRGVPWL